MKIWIIYTPSANTIKPESYEIERFIAVGKERNIDVEVMAPQQIELVVTNHDRKSILLDGKTVALPDFLLPRMGAGTTYFALAVIRQLEKLGVPTSNPSTTIETVKDKLFAHQILAGSNLPIPKTMLVKFPIDVKLIEKNIGFPVVVKTLSGSQGSGVFLSEDKQKFEDLMQLISATQSNMNIILQEFISQSRGRDLRVFVVGGRVIAAMERFSENGNFKANISQGASAKPYPISPKLEWLCVECAKLLGLEIAGIDILFDGDEYKIIEANSSPGFEGLDSTCGVNIAEVIFDYIQVRQGIFFD